MEACRKEDTEPIFHCTNSISIVMFCETNAMYLYTLSYFMYVYVYAQYIMRTLHTRTYYRGIFRIYYCMCTLRHICVFIRLVYRWYICTRLESILNDNVDEDDCDRYLVRMYTIMDYANGYTSYQERFQRSRKNVRTM